MQQPRPLHRLGDLPSAPARARAIALVRPAYWTDAREIAAAVHCDLELTSDQAAFANRIEAGEPDCAVVDSGATTSSEQLLRFARSLWPNAALVLVVPQWSDDEPRLRSVASAVLHAPIRPKEWSLVLDRVLRDRRERLA